MKYYVLLLCVFSVFLSSCKNDDKEGSVTVHFVPYYDNQPLQIFSPKDFTGIEKVQFMHLSFLLSDLALLDGSGSTELKDVELVDMSFDDLQDATEGFTITIDNLAEGDYDGIRFGVGLPPDVNDSTPNQYASSHPLSKNSYYWTAWNSYIFLKIEGTLDTLGTGLFDTGFAFHTGTDALYTILETNNIPISILDGENTDIHIAIDYKDLLQGIDIKANPQNHDPGDIQQIGAIVNNLQTAVTLFQ